MQRDSRTNAVSGPGVPISSGSPGARNTIFASVSPMPKEPVAFDGAVNGKGQAFSQRPPPKAKPVVSAPLSDKHIQCNAKLAECNAALIAKNREMEAAVAVTKEKWNAALEDCKKQAAHYEGLYKGKSVKSGELEAAQEELKRCRAKVSENEGLEQELQASRDKVRSQEAELAALRAAVAKHTKLDAYYNDILKKAEMKYEGDLADKDAELSRLRADQARASDGCKDDLATALARNAALESASEDCMTRRAKLAEDLKAARQAIDGMIADLEQARDDARDCKSAQEQLLLRLKGLEKDLSDAVAQKGDAESEVRERLEAARNAKDVADKTVAELRRQVASLEDELRIAKDGASRTSGEMSSELERLQKLLDEALAEAERCETGSVAFRTEISSLMSELETVTSELRVVRTERSELLARLDASASGKDSEIKGLQLQLATYRSESEVSISELRLQLASCGASREASEARSSELTQRLEEQLRVAEELRISVTESETRISSLNEELVRCGEANGDVTVRLQSELTEMAVHRTRLEQSVASYEATLKELQSERDAESSRSSELLLKVSSYESTIMSLRTSISEYDARVSDLQSRLAECESGSQESETLREEIRTLIATRSSYEESIASYERTISELKSKVQQTSSSYERTITELRTEIANLTRKPNSPPDCSALENRLQVLALACDKFIIACFDALRSFNALDDARDEVFKNANNKVKLNKALAAFHAAQDGVVSRVEMSRTVHTKLVEVLRALGFKPHDTWITMNFPGVNIGFSQLLNPKWVGGGQDSSVTLSAGVMALATFAMAMVPR